jgi:hypothetical protein
MGRYFSTSLILLNKRFVCQENIPKIYPDKQEREKIGPRDKL